jgi:hypothetical protein
MTDTLGYRLEDLGHCILPAYFGRTYGITRVETCTHTLPRLNRREVYLDLYAGDIDKLIARLRAISR